MLRPLRLLRRLHPSSLPRRSPPPLAGAVARRGLPHQRTHRIDASNRAALSSATRVEDAATSSPYLSVDVLCNKHDAIALSEALMCFGACSASMDETKDLEDYDKVVIDSATLEDDSAAPANTVADPPVEPYGGYLRAMQSNYGRLYGSLDFDDLCIPSAHL